MLTDFLNEAIPAAAFVPVPFAVPCDDETEFLLNGGTYLPLLLVLMPPPLTEFVWFGNELVLFEANGN